MKTTLLLALMCIFSIRLNAQIVHFNDSVLKSGFLHGIPLNNAGFTKIKYKFIHPTANNIVDENNDGEIQLTEAMNIDTLIIENGIDTIKDYTGLEAFTKLVYISIRTTNLNYDFSTHPHLKCLFLGYSGLNQYQVDTSYINKLPKSNINIANNLELIDLGIEYLNIDSINFQNFEDLLRLHIFNTNIKSFDLSKNNKIKVLTLSTSYLTNFDATALNNLDLFNCYLPNITYLDLSQNKQLKHLRLYNCSNLTGLNIKNGSQLINSSGINAFYIDGTFKLVNICCDDFNIPIVSNFNYYQKISINTFCSYQPGGDFNTITGRIYFDANNNGCDSLDTYQLTNQLIDLSKNGNTIYQTNVLTNQTYHLYAGKGNYNVAPNNLSNTYFNITPPSASVNFPDSLNHTFTQDFCIQKKSSLKDVAVSLYNLSNARPGFDVKYEIVCKNIGNEIYSGTLTFNYDSTIFTNFSCDTVPKKISNGTINWDIKQLLPFETRVFQFKMRLNSPADTPAVQINDTLNLNVSLPWTSDINKGNNNYSMNQVVVGAFDPNFIQCIGGNLYPTDKKNEYLHYIIDFENTGNYPAENIVVVQHYNNKQLDINSFHIDNTSHTMNLKITPTTIEYYFNQIQLQSNQHGHVAFQLKPSNLLNNEDSITTYADIFFDYNLPIQTNTDKVIFSDLIASVLFLSKDLSIQAYPNPSTTGKFNIEAQSTIQFIEAYDAQGRIIFKRINNQNNATQIDLSNQENGIYFLKIKTQQGDAFQKVQIEK